MSQSIILELPDDIARRARSLAARANKPLEDAAVEWIARLVTDPPVESLADPDLLSVCDSQLDVASQSELSELLADNRDGSLDLPGRNRLETLMGEYRHGLILKARAWKEAVTRGLRTAPNGDAA